MKYALIIVCAFVFIISAAIVTIPFWLNINDYKEDVAKVIQEKTGMAIKIDGDINLQAIPDLSLKLKKVSVKSNVVGNNKSFLADELLVQIKFLPLFKKMLEVDSFKISNLVVTIVVDEKKELGLIEDTKLIKSEVADSKSEDFNKISLDKISLNVDSEKFYERFLLSNLVVENGSISYVNKQDNVKINIPLFNLNTSIKPGSNKFKLTGKMDIFSDKSKGQISIDGNYFFTGKKIELDDFILNLDNLAIHSNLTADFEGERPLVKIALYAGEINLNDYHPDIFENKKAPIIDKSKLAGLQSDDKQAVDKTLKNSEKKFKLSDLIIYDIYFNFKTSGIIYKDFKIGTAELHSNLVKGILKFNIKEINLYSGLIKSDSIVDFSEIVPTIKNKIEFSNIDLSMLPKDIKYVETIQGNISGDLFLNSSGNNVNTIISNLFGKGKISVADGVVNGVDLLSMVANLSLFTKGINIGNGTKFQEILADYDIKNGIIYNDNFILRSDILNFSGNGKIDLNNLSVDYKLIPQYSQDSAANDKKDLPSLPIVISGNIFHPVFTVEVKSIVQDLIVNPQGGENIVNQLKKDFKDMKGDLKNKSLIDLKKLFD